MKRTLQSLALWAVFWTLCVSAVHAQSDTPFHIPQYTGTPAMIAMGVVTQQTLNRQSAITYRARTDRSDGQRRSTSAAPTGPAKLVVGSKPAGMPARMAARLAPPARAEAERVYQEMLDKHPQLMQQLGVPSNDLACAVATFLAGSYIAYRGVDFPDRTFKPLYEQVRGIIAADTSFARFGLAERREMFEQMVIIGTYLALTREALEQRPNPKVAADMKVAAKDYLQQFMHVDAERLRLTDQGLTVN